MTSSLLVEGPGALVLARVAGVVVHVGAPLDALALAVGVEALLVAARVLARVRQAVHAAHRHRFLRKRVTSQRMHDDVTSHG